MRPFSSAVPPSNVVVRPSHGEAAPSVSAAVPPVRGSDLVAPERPRLMDGTTTVARWAHRLVERILRAGHAVAVALEDPEALGNVKRRRLAYLDVFGVGRRVRHRVDRPLLHRRHRQRRRRQRPPRPVCASRTGSLRPLGPSTLSPSAAPTCQSSAPPSPTGPPRAARSAYAAGHHQAVPLQPPSHPHAPSATRSWSLPAPRTPRPFGANAATVSPRLVPPFDPLGPCLRSARCLSLPRAVPAFDSRAASLRRPAPHRERPMVPARRRHAPAHRA